MMIKWKGSGKEKLSSVAFPVGLVYPHAMKEVDVFFGLGSNRIEGLHADAGGVMGAVISHPHPLMGGDMGNPVVEILAETLFSGGLSTLRFNFRGVGRSTGAYDGGPGEADDVLAAVSFLREKGAREVLLAGYSFGAWVNAGVLTRGSFLPALLVAPPLTLLKFDFQAIREGWAPSSAVTGIPTAPRRG